MKKPSERVLAFTFGVVFIVVLLVLAVMFPNPTPFLYNVFRIVLALAAGGVAGMIPGFITVTVSTWLRAGGALAVFVIVYFFSPAELTGVRVKSEQELEIAKPIVVDLRSRHYLSSIAAAVVPAVFAKNESTSPVPPNLVVTKADDLLNPDVLLKRYGTITVNGVRAKVPARATLVANELQGINGAALTGTEFSIVARRLANLTVDGSAEHEPGAAVATVRLYVKIVENGRLLARGAPGIAGRNGSAGTRGADGANGRDGGCDGFGRYSGAQPGADAGNGGSGENGQPGSDGQPGGVIALTTIVNPVATTIDIVGGQSGAGGIGGAPGVPGRAGTGGRGCTGLGGNQPNQSDGRAGLPGVPGQNGPSGRPSANGEYRLVTVASFDGIVKRLAALPNDRLHAALQAP